jgi:hypothetical protein
MNRCYSEENDPGEECRWFSKYRQNLNSEEIPHGYSQAGFGASSMHWVLEALSGILRTSGKMPTKKDLARCALQLELCSSSHFLAAQDVFTIAWGGVVYTHTQPAGSVTAAIGKVSAERIEVDRGWLGETCVIACKPYGQPHHAEKLLEGLYKPQKTNDAKTSAEYVQVLSNLAREAGKAMLQRDMQNLGQIVSDARRTFFEDWAKRATKLDFVHADSRALISQLKRRYGARILGHKPPGAGNYPSAIIITPDAIEVAEFITKRWPEWHAWTAQLSDGPDFYTVGDELRIVAPQRIDFVGGADLGADPDIGAEGTCIAAAIGPRSERRFHPRDETLPYCLEVQHPDNSLLTGSGI